MKVRRVVFWAVVFTGLLLYVLLDRPEERDIQVALQADQNEKVFAVDADDIRSVRLRSAAAEVTLTRTRGDWQVTFPPESQAPTETIESLIDALTDAVVVDRIAQPAALDEYGLSDPEITIALTVEDIEHPLKLALGRTTPAGVSLYARVSGQQEVVLLGTYLRFSVRTFLDRF